MPGAFVPRPAPHHRRTVVVPRVASAHGIRTGHAQNCRRTPDDKEDGYGGDKWGRSGRDLAMLGVAADPLPTDSLGELFAERQQAQADN